MTEYPAKRLRIVSIYSASHFIVDFACAFMMFRSISEAPGWYLCVLMYNFCAFAMQMPLGVIIDRLQRNALAAVIGCALIASAYGIVRFPIAAVVTAGIGNSLFHLGGGVDVMNISGERRGALGVFVSPGAFGVWLGTMLGKGAGFPAMPLVLALLAAAALIIVCCRTPKHGNHQSAHSSARESSYASTNTGIHDRGIVSANESTCESAHSISHENARYEASALQANSPIASSRVITAVALLFLVVCLRSFVGLAINFPWKSNLLYGIPLICAVVFGKTAGGFLADRFGDSRIAVISLGIASLLFFFPGIPAAGILSLLLFNMTMPITLWAVAQAVPDAKGFAFGLLTFGLFVGFLPVHLGISVPDSALPVFPAFSALSLLLLAAGLRKLKQK